MIATHYKELYRHFHRGTCPVQELSGGAEDAEDLCALCAFAVNYTFFYHRVSLKRKSILMGVWRFGS